MTSISVVIPTIPGREALLNRAVSSVHHQTRAADALIVESDPGRTGATATRNRAFARVRTDWVAWLDDDDELLPNHLERLLDCAARTDADYVFSDWTVPEHPDFHLDSFCYGEFDPTTPLQTTITTLMWRGMVSDLGCFISPPAWLHLPAKDRAGEDFYLTERAAQNGYRIRHLHERTWLWHHHGGNTSGRGI